MPASTKRLGPAQLGIQAPAGRLGAAPQAVATPLWFGPEDRPLAGWLHTPGDGCARAGVVLCPPMGIEGICVYFTFRQLASRLAQHGFAVLRFDYDGTGDSSGDWTDPDRVPAWQESVRQATDLLAATGISRLALVGMRMGGLMAAYEASRLGGADALVLWDPCLTGAAVLRQEQARYRLALGTGPSRPDRVYGLGVSFDPPTVTALKAMSIPGLGGPLAERTLLLVDPERPLPGALLEELTGTVTDWGEATGQGELLDPPKQTPPTGTMDRVTAWLSNVFGDCAPTPTTMPPRRPAALAPTPAGTPVAEQFVCLGRSGLFGILSEPPDPRPAPTIVFVNEGNTPHIGQSRMWVDLSRRWAADGFRVLRWDLSGNGDSEARPGQEPHVPHSIESFRDVEEALEAASPDDPSNVVLVGLCSGAYQSIEAALTLKPRAIYLLNPALVFTGPDGDAGLRQAKPVTRAWLARLARGPVYRLAIQRSEQHALRWTDALDGAGWVAALARRFPGVPDWAWTLVNWLCIANRPTQVLERVVRSGVEVLVVASEEDLVHIRVGASRAMRRLQAMHGFHLDVPERLDHSILDAQMRAHVMDYLSDHLLSRYPRLSPGSPTAL